MKPRSTAECGTPAGYHRHARAFEKACGPCRDAENEANRRREAGDAPPKRFCGCGREVRSAEHDRCHECRRAAPQPHLVEVAFPARPECVECKDPLPNKRRDRCVVCEQTQVVGWMRLYPGGPLVGSHLPHNHATDCTVHVFCDNRREAA